MKIKLILLLFLSPFVLFGQSWDYPIKPGTEEWKKLKSVDDMYQKCQIPNIILKQLKTEDLVDICLKFPSPPQFLLFNSPQECFLSFFSNFNGIRELFARKDAASLLIKKYCNLSMDDYDLRWPLYRQGEFISHYKFIESILAQSEIICLLKDWEKKTLMKEIIFKMEGMNKRKDFFSDNNRQINLWLMTKLLLESDALKLEDNKSIFLPDLYSGILLNIDQKDIYQQAKKYVYEIDK